MYKTPKESLAFLEAFLPLVKEHTRDEIAIFPTMSSLGYVLDATRGSKVNAGAQTMHWLEATRRTVEEGTEELHGPRHADAEMGIPTMTGK